MKKKSIVIVAAVLVALCVATCFAGCSSAGRTPEQIKEAGVLIIATNAASLRSNTRSAANSKAGIWTSPERSASCSA